MKLSSWRVALSLCVCLVLIGCQKAQPSASTTGATPAADGDALADASAEKATDDTTAAADDTTAPAANGDDAAVEAEGEVVVIKPGPDAQKAAQEALMAQ